MVELREVFNARGTVTSSGSLRQWTNGNLHALLEPAASGHRLRLGTLNGNARGSMIGGLATLGVGVAMTLAVAAGGEALRAAPGIVFLWVTGLGMFVNGALRLPSWARLRGRRMEHISARLALPVGPAAPSLPPIADD